MTTKPASNRKRYLTLALRVLGTCLLVGLVLHTVPLGDTWTALRGLAPGWVAWALAAELAARVVSILRWHLLLAPAGVRVPFTTTLRLGFIALFYNNFMPSTLGGDVAKSVLAIRGGQSSPAAIVASVLVDRAVVGWGSLVAFGVVIGIVVDFPPFRYTMLVVLGGGLIAAVITALLARRQVSDAGQPPAGLVARLVRKVVDKLTEVSSALVQYRHHRGTVFAAWLVSCVGITLTGLAVQCWCTALGYPLPLLRMVAVAVILKIAGIVPVSIGNVGWTEGATLLLLRWAGMPQPVGLAVGVLQRVAGMTISLTGAVLQLGTPTDTARRPDDAETPGNGPAVTPEEAASPAEPPR